MKPNGDWSEKNQNYLVASLSRIRFLLQKYGSRFEKSEPPNLSDDSGTSISWDGDMPPAIENLRVLFQLSEFEVNLLLLCAGVELDSEIARLCAGSQNNANSPYPTFGLALAAFPNAHWSALAPASPLRRFSLINLLGGPRSPTLTSTPLQIEERVLHYLTGITYIDPELVNLVRPIRDCTSRLVDSHQMLVERILLSCRNSEREKIPIIQLWGSDNESKELLAMDVSSSIGLQLCRVEAERISLRPEEMERFVKLWTREAALLGSALYVSAEDVDAATQKTISHITDLLPGPLFLGTRDRWPLRTTSRTISLEVKKPEKAEQRHLWKTCISPIVSLPNEHEISKLSGQFNLSAPAIRAAVQEASLMPSTSDKSSLYESLWTVCLGMNRPRLDELAQFIVPRATISDLVLPDAAKTLLAEIAVHVAERQTVYEEWGFEEKTGSRGLGITALFSGPSGTGKTMAAEALANQLHLDLFRIDIATVVSKYIGETEKNLRKVFDAAEDGGAILFFDEADALFGKRSEVHDSHDRYANIEISYLLQRMENYRGLAILSTNMKNALDPAFTRRIRFFVDFPFPDKKSRVEIWRRIFPAITPIDAPLDVDRLARLNISGGNIRNIALFAAFLAAGEGVPVGMRHLKRGAQVEYDKLERPLTQMETGDW